MQRLTRSNALPTPNVPSVQRGARRPNLQAVSTTTLSRAAQLQGQIADVLAEQQRLSLRLAELTAALAAEVRLAEMRLEASSDAKLPDLLSVQEIARRLSVSERQILNYLDDGTLPSRRLGTRRLIAAADYQRYLQSLAPE